MVNKECLNKERNEERCPCPEEYCKRRGICCECIAYHRAQNELPACLR